MSQIPANSDPPPVRPDAPDPGDCCGGGCVHCVYDLYDAALERYQAAYEIWLARQPADTPADDTLDP